MQITFKQTGTWNSTSKFLNTARNLLHYIDFTKYGIMGVNALSKATPVDTGKTSESWHYKITTVPGKVNISFYNTNIQNGVPIAIILQYGHGTRNGGWVEGRDYINPAIQPLFDEITKKAWEEVKD